MKCAANIDARMVEETAINLDPIQVAGRLTPEAMKAMIAWGDGYSVCDNCRKPFRLDYIQNPPLKDFHVELAEWLGMDQARTVPGARRAFQQIAGTYVEKGDPVLIGALAHYTSYLSVEIVQGIVREIPKTADNHITADAAADRIEDVIREFGKAPKLLYIDHVDYQFGNMHDVAGIAKVAHQYDVPILYNGVYTVGVMPVNGKKLGVDFVVGSGHKSMAAPAPSGVLAATEERAEEVFRTTKMTGDLTGRTFGIKEVGIIGCSLMGAPIVGMLASFPKVKARVEHFDEEMANSKIIVDALKSIEGTKILSEYPRKHTLTRVDTTGSFDIVAQTHKKRGFFLSSALGKKGITGIIPGATKVWKFNTYGMTRKQAEYVADTYLGIAEDNGLRVA
ncbi:O-phospho-L-seryl-tRNA:Cys-tRNA synthase [Methanocorpusculum vombati]|uniref:O-phospho-L-seryl-tRNA:Cys-tRNA synthase n=1 Tax=Methanocorpusculum vombati TaxID=3002864 RepID=A0ABT4IN92_9EURY|nr:O-phospho-L-seryl-tRNA:Cys-tRNA synthase [Methanocorpusculum vombati]MCZ9320349.1 O-phospho-L-seryl-tRNA:Cys-tRNA synthase [Methanocorpusculum sp.]MCZ0863228.1 O-phospho-L-seryl-tRNA:Cys-tRNA synthase [Methanocorpusculum vombati]MDE2520327.1 O-phospho-L-seryl-tRNA:Cys-tRNA synthase [Methanocorpusculum sp.]MDE2534332.1 O-phospho-L-seryl-tRNA:Cys-tRNA synthase [Methanocorpusculum sp.]MDE2546208.1 O-phospho-L-seryl-tRNA:Cys-tRNA synthase [Methanocorpusculum sp.]